ncbi:uncharacterized protein EHS24_003762 [Apiotrichum porosum]|uniref:Uncharacterized protein n=1 Tax=Apiotrichum porosum TaxID=105984 RepID=A0A427XE81_9TREE|nr:uncharacterized protein EHS24_003762 [Apiotrichum porosum]RSH77132.1 hypothetical protein EHS24_003762 [Apiotrichum porosum]
MEATPTVQRYDKLSPGFPKAIDALEDLYRSSVVYTDGNNPGAPRPIIRGTVDINGFSQTDAPAMLAHLIDIYEKSLDAQPSTPPLYGYAEGTAADEPRHGARVTSLAEVPFNSDNGVSRRATLGLKQDDT